MLFLVVSLKAFFIDEISHRNITADLKGNNKGVISVN